MQACGLVDVVVTVVVQSQRRGRSDDTAGEEVVKSNLLWADSLLQIIGLGLVKIAVALMVFRFAARTWLRSTAVGYICPFPNPATHTPQHITNAPQAPPPSSQSSGSAHPSSSMAPSPSLGTPTADPTPQPASSPPSTAPWTS